MISAKKYVLNILIRVSAAQLFNAVPDPYSDPVFFLIADTFLSTFLSDFFLALILLKQLPKIKCILYTLIRIQQLKNEDPDLKP